MSTNSFKIEYAILRYSPSIVSGERINLGVLFYNTTTQTPRFFHTKKWSRISNFDDELDVNFIKAYLNGISSDLDQNLYNYNGNKIKAFSMKNYIMHFTNEFKFSQPIYAFCNDYGNFVETTKKVFLRFDYEKGSRLSKTQELNYIESTIFKNASIPYKRNQVLRGAYQEDIRFDFVGNNMGIKWFGVKGKSIKRLIPYAKMWAWNAEKLKSSKNFDVVFLYDDDEKDDPHFKIIHGILSEYALKMVNISESVDFFSDYVPA